MGRKTAACVLLFSFGMHDVPVDTHVSRVVTRLGMFRPGAAFEEMHDDFLGWTQPGEELELHVNPLRHGRRTCHAQRPRLRRLRAAPHVPEGRRRLAALALASSSLVFLAHLRALLVLEARVSAVAPQARPSRSRRGVRSGASEVTLTAAPSPWPPAEGHLALGGQQQPAAAVARLDHDLVGPRVGRLAPGGCRLGPAAAEAQPPRPGRRRGDGAQKRATTMFARGIPSWATWAVIVRAVPPPSEVRKRTVPGRRP